jgi:Na+/H+-dicarboxylate symporter
MNGVSSFKGESWKVILILVPLVCVSNFSGFITSYICTSPLLKTGFINISKLDVKNVLEPAWSINLVPLVKNDVAMMAGVACGIASSFSKNPAIEKANIILSKAAGFLLKKVILVILPFFIVGFIVKMKHEETLSLVIKEYSLLLGVLTVVAYGYMFILMFFLSSSNLRTSFARFKNLLPGVLIGLFSMSSAAAIPSTIEASEKNLKNKNIARFVVPATANMHLLGDCFALPIIGLALMVSFGYKFPTFYEYFIFSLYGVVAKFAAAGIPGGSAIIFIPIFESVFNFSPTMLTAVTAIYVLFDPIATSSNVFGHGVFAVLFEKVYTKIFKVKT